MDGCNHYNKIKLNFTIIMSVHATGDLEISRKINRPGGGSVKVTRKDNQKKRLLKNIIK